MVLVLGQQSVGASAVHSVGSPLAAAGNREQLSLPPFDLLRACSADAYLSVGPRTLATQGPLNSSHNFAVMRSSTDSIKNTELSEEFLTFLNNVVTAASIPDIAAQQVQNARIFADVQLANRLLQAFVLELKNAEAENGNSLSTTMVKSTLGCTGYTFLCTAPIDLIDEEAAPMPIRFVLKWQDKQQCNVERIGAMFFESLGFAAPQIVIPDARIAIQLSKFAAKIHPAMLSMPDNYAMIVMPQLFGNNFHDAVLNGNLKKLSADDADKVMQQFGGILVGDLLLGNNDRLVKFSSNFEVPFKTPSSFNSGNVMLQIRNSQLKGIFPIDNCPPADLRTVQYDEAEDLGFLGGFLGEEQRAAATSSEVSTPSSASAFSVSTQTGVKEEEEIEKRITGYHSVFRKLITDVDLLVNNMITNLHSDILEHDADIESYNRLFENADAQIKLGMKQTLERIRKFNLDKFISGISQVGLNPHGMESLTQRSIKLLRMNIEFVQQQVKGASYNV